MQTKTISCKLVSIALLVAVFLAKGHAQKNLLPFVNPFIGTAAHGHTFPGACYPFGMMQLSPDTRLGGWDGCSGYHYSDTVMYGFTHTHLSGTGCSDYGDILLMPVPAEPYTTSNGITTIGDYSSSFSHSNEKASPGYYAVQLNNGNIKAELTVGKRAGMHRYLFSADDSCNVVLNLHHRETVLNSNLTVLSDTEVCGLRVVSGWAKYRQVYFDIQFSKPFQILNVFNNDTSIAFQKMFNSKNIKAVFHFKHSDTLLVKIGISAVSMANAKLNLMHDIPAWNFAKRLKETQAAWNAYLNKIEVSSKNDSLLTIFYTALYHTAIHPSLFTDVNGQYRGMDEKIHTAQDFNIYTVFSLWDTYRALHPLYTIIAPSIDRQFIQTFLKQYEQNGALPVWELWANETNCMIGYHAVSVIYDAFNKEIYGYNPDEATDAMKHSAMEKEPGTVAMRRYGYVPSDADDASVSKTLEYAYDDWCIAKMCQATDKMEDYMYFIKLAQAYKNVYDPNTGFMRARANGGWYSPFSPYQADVNYTEADAWQYSFYVPQDMNGLIKLHGGKEKLSEKLDSLFTVPSDVTGQRVADITGMLGQYAQGNEPSHHIAYLFNYVGKPWKTAYYVRKIEALYNARPNGLCGNDDCGQMSAWYVMSAMGLYQVCPGNEQVCLTAPLFDTVQIHFENGKTFTITSYKESPDAAYISSASLNYKNYSKSYITYGNLIKGGRLSYMLSNTPSANWGTGNNVPADSIVNRETIIPEPYVTNNSYTFTDSLQVEIKGYSPADKIYYTLNDSLPTAKSALYRHPFYIHKTCYVKAVAYRGDKCSMANGTSYTRIPAGRSIKVLSVPDPRYDAGGPNGLIDYQYGSTNFRLGKWQGYQGQDFEAVVNLGKEERIKVIKAEFLQDVGSWIMMPVYVDFYVSSDGRHFTKVAHLLNTLPDTAYTPTIKVFAKNIKPKKIRYVKVLAKSYGKLPAWHPGAGSDSYIFIDEIIAR